LANAKAKPLNHRGHKGHRGKSEAFGLRIHAMPGQVAKSAPAGQDQSAKLKIKTNAKAKPLNHRGHKGHRGKSKAFGLRIHAMPGQVDESAPAERDQNCQIENQTQEQNQKQEQNLWAANKRE